jgi:hypothetical protein
MGDFSWNQRLRLIFNDISIVYGSFLLVGVNKRFIKCLLSERERERERERQRDRENENELPSKIEPQLPFKVALYLLSNCPKTVRTRNSQTMFDEVGDM